MTQPSYKPRDFHLSGLTGISDRTTEMHVGLYRGYVKNINLLTEQLMEMALKRTMTTANPAYAALTHRLGFEYGGMVLHEYYFEGLAPKGRGTPSRQLTLALEQSFGSVENWKNAFVAVGNMRGVGWAGLYQNPTTGKLSNHWIALHQDGVPFGLEPILVMDVWEHAFLLDYMPPERSKYIDAFFSNLDWSVLDKRLTPPTALRAVA